MKRLLLLILLINLHVSAQDAWSCLVENEKQIVRDLIIANYKDDISEHVDTSALVSDAYWTKDSIAHVKTLYMRVGNLDDPEILPWHFDTTIEELGELKYLESFDIKRKHQIKYLWNSINKNDMLKSIKAQTLITLPKTIAGCDSLTDIELGKDLEYLPDEFLDLHLFPFTDWNKYPFDQLHLALFLPINRQ